MRSVGAYAVSGGRGVGEAVADGVGDGVGAAAGADLGVDVDGVALDGAYTDDERVGDLLVALARRDAAQHLDLAVAEAVRVLGGSGRGSAGGEPFLQAQ